MVSFFCCYSKVIEAIKLFFKSQTQIYRLKSIPYPQTATGCFIDSKPGFYHPAKNYHQLRKVVNTAFDGKPKI